MLEGKELEGNIGEVGSYFLDVDDKGKVEIALNVAKDFGHTQVKSDSSVKTDIFKIVEEITKKTDTVYDDKLVAGLKMLLGIKE